MPLSSGGVRPSSLEDTEAKTGLFSRIGPSKMRLR